MSKSDLVDVSVQLHHETPKAILVSNNGEPDEAIWLPKSQIEFSPPTKSGCIEVTLPEWLAHKHGLI